MRWCCTDGYGVEFTLLTAMIAALAWGLAAGCLARAVLGDHKPGVLMTVIAGLGGSVIGFLVMHELLGRHEMHLFAPESLLPASAAALGLLLAHNRLRRARRRKTIFG